MKYPSRTNQELLEEISILKQRIQELKKLETEHKRTEELIKSEALLFEMTNQVPGLVYQFYARPNGELGLYYVSDKSEQVVGLKPDLEGFFERFTALVIPEHRDGFIKSIEKAVKEASIWKYEGMLQKPSGEKIWFSGNSTPSPRENEMVFNSIIQDITDRKQAEEKLRESEEHFRNLYEEAPNAMFSVGTDGIIRRCNRRAGLLLGCPTDVLVGKPIFEIYADTPDGKVKAMRIFEQFRAGEKINDKELQMQKADGTHVWVSLSVNQIRGGGDQILESRSMVVDITDRKEAEEKLQESEKYFKEITENSSDIIIITDKNGAIKYCSRSVERFTGYKPGELIGRNALKLIHPDDVKRAISDFGKAILSADSAIPNAFRIVHKDGSERYFDGLGRNLLDNPAIAGFIMNVRDMTERKKAEVLLQASEERSRELAELLPETVFEMNLQGMLTFVNMRAVNMFGYTRQEFIQGLAALDTVIPDDREQAQKNIQRILHGENFGSQEYTMLRKDGGTFPALIRTTVIIRHGKPDGLRGTVVDITERKKAEEKLKETLERLRKAIGATIQVMVSAIERRDPYTAGHQSRSATLARTIATEMGLPQEKIEGIRIASSIHDIGKLSIPAEILSKPTKLSELEFALIKEHSRQGYEILKNVESSWPLAEIVYQHHERMDGSGYPRNLKGDDILLEARILAVADVVEAMASNRPYRPGKGIETALEEIEKNKGLLYDDAVANVCLRLFREKGYKM